MATKGGMTAKRLKRRSSISASRHRWSYALFLRVKQKVAARIESGSPYVRVRCSHCGRRPLCGLRCASIHEIAAGATTLPAMKRPAMRARRLASAFFKVLLLLVWGVYTLMSGNVASAVAAAGAAGAALIIIITATTTTTTATTTASATTPIVVAAQANDTIT